MSILTLLYASQLWLLVIVIMYPRGTYLESLLTRLNHFFSVLFAYMTTMAPYSIIAIIKISILLSVVI